MTQKIKLSDYKMLRWSMDFIQQNPDLTTDRLPDELIKFWTIQDFTTNPQSLPQDLQLLIFMYILRLVGYDTEEAGLILNSYRFNRLFYGFQVTAYCRENDIEITPFPIFQIDKYSIPDLRDGEELMRQYEIVVG